MQLYGNVQQTKDMDISENTVVAASLFKGMSSESSKSNTPGSKYKR